MIIISQNKTWESNAFSLSPLKMSSGREIITLQFGNYSNFVGSHLWNIQESSFNYDGTDSDISHDVLFREGQNLKGDVTFTPRLLLVDLKESLHNEYVTGNLYEDTKNDESCSGVLWEKEKVERKIEEHGLSKHKYLQDLDSLDEGENIQIEEKNYNFPETVFTWCDYLRTRLHPRSVNIINEYVHDDSSKMFDLFHLGSSIYKDLNFQEEYDDKVRSYVEECDNLDGFQIIVDIDDGFSGLTSAVCQMLDDEYQNKTKLVYSLIPNSYKDPSPVKDVFRMLNTAVGLQQISEFTSLCVPLSTNKTCWRGSGRNIKFPYLSYGQSYYETSSIIASLLDTVSVSFRSKKDFVSLFDVTSGLSAYGRKFAAGSLGLPFPLAPGSYLLDTLEKMDESLWTGMTPSCDVQDDRVWIQRVVLRGLTDARIRNPKHRFEASNPAYTCNNVKEMLSLFLNFCSYATVSSVSTLESPMKTDVPFPQIFSPNVSRIGSVDPKVERVDGFKVKFVPVIAGLHSCKSLGHMLQDLIHNVKKVKIKRFHQLTKSDDFTEDDFSECFEKLKLLQQCYTEEFEV